MKKDCYSKSEAILRLSEFPQQFGSCSLHFFEPVGHPREITSFGPDFGVATR
jgi:hypothetical protein